MRLERLTTNKIKIFLTSDDLIDRGLSKEDIGKDASKWNQLFHEMLEEASLEFNVDIQGSVAVEVFSLQAQGMIMIITVDDDKEEALGDGFIEMQVRACGMEKLLFEFAELEDLINAAERLAATELFGGTIFTLNNVYYLLMDQASNEQNEKAACLLSEYGNASILSPHILVEYGKIIIKNKAVETLLHYFK
ncbi:adaptor protein MecA [Neobacillus sp. OS1-32]|jgi:adapter protein MecA 1/2|uniref:Adaptor protein MecA n=1 Tax=Neobacillus paridis TaxID=2803862 RepID=A0ABS1TS23_9BACI|nr:MULTISPECIES: adaptor protein MecA [Neobacillus]MBL4954111.1 adaptor protein MecA [Neobacillus paridis]WML30843.1 adaptor protein MecA [Neobacillus sp. OS1-32]